MIGSARESACRKLPRASARGLYFAHKRKPV